MSRLIPKTGDLFTTTAEGIGHGVNCRGLMGSGIAVQFRERYREMYPLYANLTSAGGLIPGECFTYRVGSAGERGSWVFNIASQNQPGADARLEWLTAGVQAALTAAHRRGVRTLALPQIGCGIGGLNWDDVLPVLTQLAEESPVDIEAWTYA